MIATAPQILIDALRDDAPKPTTVATGDSILEGGRNTALLSFAGTMRHAGASEDVIYAAITAMNAERCDPPLDDTEVRGIASSAANYPIGVDVAGVAEVGEFTDALKATWDFEQSRALADVRARLGVGTQRARRTKPMGVRGPDLMARTFAKPTWLVQGLITDGGTGVIATLPKSGKTWAGTEIAMAVATGTRAFGEFQCRKARTFYFYAEDDERAVQARLRALATSRAMTSEQATADMSLQPRGEYIDVMADEDIADIVASVRWHGGADLVVLDPLRDIHSGEEDASGDMANVMKRLRVIGELLGCTVLVVHHNTKSPDRDRPGQNMRGSGAIHGSIDSGIYFGELSGDGVHVLTNEVRTELKSARSAGVFDLTLTIQDGPDGTAERAGWAVSRKADREVAALAKALTREAEVDRILVDAVMARAREGVYKGPSGWRDLPPAGLSARETTAAIARCIARGALSEKSHHPVTGHSAPGRGNYIAPAAAIDPDR
jgi:hypothetical protein